jgi:hypothetical protein
MIIVATLIVDENKLKDTFCKSIGCSPEQYSFSDAFKSEMGWIQESGICLEDWVVNKK